MDFPIPTFSTPQKRASTLLLHKAVLILTAIASVACNAFDSETLKVIDSLTLSQLEDRREAINTEMLQIARYSLQSGVGPIGYRSNPNASPDIAEFIQIDLGKETLIDMIILAPTIWRGTQTGFRADGFPRSFKIVAGTSDNLTGVTVASIESDEHSPTRLAPLVIPFDALTASWVRIETSLLSPRAWDNKYTLQLSEIMVFSEEENVALGKTVTTYSNPISNTVAWSRRYLVDGSLPYLMDAAQGSQSVSFVSSDIEETSTITIDLESPYALSQINLHTVDQSDTVPQAFAGDFGFPNHLTIHGANQPDFSDAHLLLDFHRDGIFDVSPIVMKKLERIPSRFIRLTAIEPYSINSTLESGVKTLTTRLGFAEIELFSNGDNVALHKKAISIQGPNSPDRSISALTDGNNLYGEILPLRDWMLQLSKRHDLEIELPLVEAELNQRYERQKANLQILVWIIAALIVGAVILVLIDRYLRQQAVFRTKERIAADLHDELGANLHAIALLSDLAQAAKDAPEKAAMHLERIRSVIQRTGESVKYVTNMLDTPGMYEDLIGEMKRSARRITTDLNHDLVFEDEEQIKKIKPRKRIDLFLFYNECLVNIIRHSGATHVKTRLSVNTSEVNLTVSDNGKGLPVNSKLIVPPSLKRRARLLGGQLSATAPTSGGTLISLQMRLKK
ncbi:MAG: ATP-binding protein [Opitutales bacterium]|nr:ATP-binding protein [Opitutales bacterium]